MVDHAASAASDVRLIINGRVGLQHAVQLVLGRPGQIEAFRFALDLNRLVRQVDKVTEAILVGLVGGILAVLQPLESLAKLAVGEAEVAVAEFGCQGSFESGRLVSRASEARRSS